MTQVPARPAIIIEEGPLEGAHAAIVAMHAAYYSRTWGFGPFFAAKVSDELAAFLARYDNAHDRVLVAVTDTGIVGSLVVDGGEGDDAGTAHLRWFIVDDANRGQGVGRTLMDAGMAFIRSAGFVRCYLTTFAGLDAARAHYERAGFRLVREDLSQTWGTPVMEQRFEWPR